MFAGFASPGFLSVAIFEYSPARIVVDVSARTVISGNEPPTARSSDRLQINERFPLPVMLHVHPAPETAVIVVSFGRVSSTVVSPVAVTGQRFRVAKR